MIGWLRRLFAVARRRSRFESDLDDELGFHLQCRAEQLIADGLDRAGAERQARLELGMLELHRDQVRRVRGLDGLDAMAADLRYGWRGLRRSPAFTFTAVAVLTLPMAAGLLLLAMLDAYVWRMPPIDDVGRWVSVSGHSADGWHWTAFTPDEAQALVASPPSALRGLYSVGMLTQPLETDGLHAGMGEAVSDNFFSLTGVAARLGRVFATGADARDRDGVVLSELGWQRLFAGRADVLGRRLAIGGQDFEVIGIAGRGFSGTLPVPALYWVRESDYRRRIAIGTDEQPALELSGFVADGVSTTAAAEALTARIAALTADRELPLVRAEVEPRPGFMAPEDYAEARLIALPAVLAVVLMLAVAASNLANLVLARFAARRHDVVLRAALGAGRARLFGGLLVECSLIALLAAPLALAITALALPPLHVYVFGWIAELVGFELRSLHLSWRALPLAVALAGVAVLCFGVLPAWLVSAPGALGRGSPAATLKRVGGQRLRGRLMVVQVATSVLLLIVASLLAGNARRVAGIDLGFAPERLIAMRAGSDPVELAAQVRAMPDVEQVAASSSVPLSMQQPERVEVRVDDSVGTARVRWIDPAWLQTVGIAPERGTGFTHGGDSQSRAALVSRAAAERWWPGSDPIGRSLRLSTLEPSPLHPDLVEHVYDIVGVVPDLASVSLIEGRDPAMVYLPARLGEPVLTELLIRSRAHSPQLLDALHRSCTAIDATAMCRPRTVSGALALQRLPLAIAGRAAATIGWITLGISCLGLYGLVSYAVVQRRREFGVRLAIGAGAGDLIRLVMRDATRQTVTGLALGLLAASLTARLLTHFIEHLQVFDLFSFGVTPLLLCAVALAASWLPARRTSRIDPTEALRAQD